MTPDRSVEVIFPRSAPHLAPIAARMEATLTTYLENLPAAAAPRLLRELAAIEAQREAYARFRNRIGIKQPGD